MCIYIYKKHAKGKICVIIVHYAEENVFFLIDHGTEGVCLWCTIGRGLGLGYICSTIFNWDDCPYCKLLKEV